MVHKLLATIGISGQNEDESNAMYLQRDFLWKRRTRNLLLITNSRLFLPKVHVGQIFFNIRGWASIRVWACNRILQYTYTVLKQSAHFHAMCTKQNTWKIFPTQFIGTN